MQRRTKFGIGIGIIVVSMGFLAWLGYGEVLFLRLGDSPIVARSPDGRRARPPYELHTNFSDWSVQSRDSSVRARIPYFSGNDENE